MERKKPKNPALYGALLGLSGIFTLGAVLTLVPNPGARWENVLGYKSLCTFAPVATAVCAFLAGATCAVRARVAGPRAGEKRSPLPALVVAAALAAVVALTLPAYLSVKADVGTGASASAAP
jgi:hypothetical protein